MRYFIFLASFMLLNSCWEGNTTTTPPNTPKSETFAPTINTDDATIKKNITALNNINPKWLCVPGKRVGLITNNSTEADIISAYGKENVVRRTIGMGEGETTEGTVVFPDTDNEIVVEWESGKTYQKPRMVRIEKANSPWTTDQNIAVGTSLEKLAGINGKDFNFAGFEWDYAGKTNDWQGGNINKQITVYLEAAKPGETIPDLLGDVLFSSSNPKAKAAELKVRSIEIGLE